VYVCVWVGELYSTNCIAFGSLRATCNYKSNANWELKNVGMEPERNFKSKRFISYEYVSTKAYQMRVITHTHTHTRTPTHTESWRVGHL